MDDLSNTEVAFLGKVTASVSHDLQNALAVIRESSGLMEDILAINKDAIDPSIVKKLSSCLSSVGSQVNRGVATTSNLNGFAHTADLKKVNIDLTETLKRLFFLTRRIFLHQGLEIEIEESSKSTSIFTEPVLFQAIFFDCVLYSSLLNSSNSTIQIVIDDKLVLKVLIKRTSDCLNALFDKENLWNAICYKSARVGAAIKTLESDSGLCIEM